MTWRGTCALCGASVTGHSDGGALDLPAGGQAVVCLVCLCFESGKAEEALAPEAVHPPVERELADVA